MAADAGSFSAIDDAGALAAEQKRSAEARTLARARGDGTVSIEPIWQRETFKIATKEGIKLREGWTFKGVGLYLNGTAGMPGVCYELVHLNTGHAICNAGMVTTLEKAFRVGQAIAEIAPWEDFGLNFANVEPELQQKVGRIMREAFPIELETKRADQDELAARAIAAERES